MEKRKPGRPKGTREYPDQIFINAVENTPQTTEEIMRKLRENTTINWSTTQRYLTRLLKQGKINKIYGTKYHLWIK